jgi:hypothetical protein
MRWNFQGPVLAHVQNCLHNARLICTVDGKMNSNIQQECFSRVPYKIHKKSTQAATQDVTPEELYDQRAWYKLGMSDGNAFVTR